MLTQMPSTTQLLSLFLIFTRGLAVLITGPIFSQRSIPAPFKIGLAGLLSLLILPAATSHLNPVSTPFPQDLPRFLLVVAQEILIGVLIGFVSNLVFVAVDIAAKIMGLQMGFQAANLLNPLNNTTGSALEQFYTLLALTLFLIINGHHWLIAALARTFDIAPLGTFVLTHLTLEHLMVMTNETFNTAIRISLPVGGTLLLTDLGLGLVARAVPHVQVFFLGLPLKLGLGLLVLALSMIVTLPLIKDLLTDMVKNVLIISSQ
jgi:flagellar biosynthesis protein FliR